MIRIFAVCGMGLGTSAILKSRLREATTGADYQLDVTDASAISGQRADLVFTSNELAERMGRLSAKVVVINNFMDREEIRRKATKAVAALE